MGGKHKKKSGKDKLPTTAQDFKQLGNKAYVQKDWARAIELYSQAIALDGKNGIYHNNKAAAHFEAGQLEESLKEADIAIELMPDLAKAHYRRAKILYELCDSERAVEAIKRAEAILESGEEEKSGLKDVVKELGDEVKEEWEADSIKGGEEETKEQEFLLQTLEQGGARLDKLKLRWYAEGYRGVHAKRNIRKNEEILYVPRDLIITLEMAKAAPIGKKMVDAGLDLLSPKHCFLTTYVLQERRNLTSKWKFFLDILPKTMENFPIFFSESEEVHLEGSPFLEQVKDKRRDIEKDYETIAAVAPELRQWTVREFSEVRMMVSSRIFGMNIEGQKTDGFVPMADMLNHKRPRETSWTYTDEKAGFVIEACQDIPRNNQVFDSYGKKCNSRFFLNYGFIVQNNDGNEVPLRVHLRSDDPLLSLKKQLLADGATTSSSQPGQEPFRKFRVTEDMRARTTRECLSFLRYVLYDEKVAMLYQFQSTNTPPAYALNESDDDSDDDKDDTSFKATNIPAVSITNERAVLVQLKLLCQEALSKYPTSWEEDEQFLEQPPVDLTFNHRNCVLMRAGEKKVLHFLISAADLYLALLACKSSKEARKAFKAAKKVPEGGLEDYFQSVVLQLLKNEPAA